MPDFRELTQQVVQVLDPEKYSDTANAFDGGHAGDYSKPKVPLDQIYQLLDSEYGREEVDKLVTNFLKDTSESDPSREHKLIAKISSDLEGRPQIVTTNFDRLFDKCQGVTSDRIFKPPAFLGIEFGMPVHGVTHLHGRLPEPDKPHHGYILSSADFGRAYLAEGWATRFIQALLEKFTVVLVGYQAEDPPVKYLLLGLNRNDGMGRSSLYAFDKGASSEVKIRWRDQGVSPIAYNDHCDLWNTLEAWADRVEDSIKWKNSVVEMAKQNPRMLKPHERGQVMHLVRTKRGAELFAQSEPPPPAEWLCVFDASRRVPKRESSFQDVHKNYSLLENYSLDDDPVWIQKARAHEPDVADHLFEWRPGDANPTTVHDLTGRQVEGQEATPPRLLYLIHWLSNHLNSPCLAWWATKHHDLHPRLIYKLSVRIGFMTDLHPKARNVWNLILEAMKDKRRSVPDDLGTKFYRRIKSDGWTNGTLRTFENTMGPALSFTPLIGITDAIPPEGTWDDVSISEIAKFEVKFPSDIGELGDIADEFLEDVFRLADGHLRSAITMHKDVGTKYFTTPTCYPGQHVHGRIYNRDDESYFRWFVGLLRRMSEKHPKVLRSFAKRWDHKDNFFFRKLKLFALNHSQVFEANEVVESVMEFRQQDIWDYDVRRELLFLLGPVNA